MILELKTAAIKRVDEIKATLFEISQFIYDHPEMGFEEFKCSAYLKEFLSDAGFRVTEGIAGLATAFHAVKGSGRPRIGLMAEYDAVSPELGHACGHNIIAASSVGAAVILADLAEACGGGTIEVFGTPAEEEGGGKVYIADAGLFDGLDAVFYMHPSYSTRIGGKSLATRIIDVEIKGKTAHAARFPHHGINATSAMVNLFQIIDSLRQQFSPGTKLNGVIQQGGQYPSSINDCAKARFQAFAVHPSDIDGISELIERTAKGVSIATNTKCKVHQGPLYLPRKPNLPLAQLMEQNMRQLGLEVEEMPGQEEGYTDVGNVCEAAPTVQGYISLHAGKVSNHTPEFAALAGGEKGREAILNAAKIMVMTGVDLLTQPEMVLRIQEYFKELKGS